MLHRLRYSRWDGTQNVFDMDAEDLMDALSDDLTAHGDMRRALRDMYRRGLKDREGRNQQPRGLRELTDQLRQKRREQLQKYNLDSVVDDLKAKLDEILNLERSGIDKRVDEARKQAESSQGDEKQQRDQLMKMLEQRAQKNKDKLDSLPPSMGGKVQELMDYNFMDPEAQQKFQEFMEQLKKQMLDNISKNMKQTLQNLTSQDMQSVKQMMRDLNQMLKDKAAGREPNFDEFMKKHGDMFGDNPPQNMDELLDQMAKQMAQMQSLMNSMSPEQRQELQDLMSSLMDSEMQQELSEMAGLLEQMMPMEDMRREYPFIGDESLTMEQAMKAMQGLQEMDELERSIQDAVRNGDLDKVDPNQVEDVLGEEAKRLWDELKNLQKMLEESGYIKKTDDEWDMTPKAIRRIGHKALQEVFKKLKKDRAGTHIVQTRGAGGENLGETKQYEFGDPFDIDLKRSIMNAVERQGPSVPVRMIPDDFEVYRNEHMTRSSTVVLLDQSRSMGLFGSFLAAKKVALALFSLLRSQYPRDSLHVVGFSDYAREIPESELPQASWNTLVSGTNIQHALLVARKLLNQDRAATRQIILITDGEPTTHLEGTRAVFSYPPSYRTLQETMNEVRRCTQDGVVINTFMLENNYQLMDFIGKLTRLNKGRAFYTTPDKLGEYVLVDYLSSRRTKKVA